MVQVKTILLVLVVAILSVVFKEVYNFLKIFSLPDKPIVEYQWWGKNDSLNEDENIYPFKINVSQEILDDLHYRLKNARPFTKPLENNQWYGFNGDLAHDILSYWRTEYDWREREQYLNQYPQYITSIQGLKIHFIHAKPEKIPEDVLVIPLLILHGWPGSIREFYDIIPMLTTPQEKRKFVFEVVAPHLPGFAFSEAASKPGLGAVEVSLVLKNLMNRLGFRKFYVQGGDLGSIVAHAISVNFEESVLGFHNNMCSSIHPYSLLKIALGSVYPKWIGSETHQKIVYPVTDLLSFVTSEMGYLHIQATKPDSLGVSMDDSPIGLAVYYLEKFSTGASWEYRFRKDAGLTEKFTYEALLDNIMFYWINRSATTAFRFYAEIFNKRSVKATFWIPVKIPTACARFRYDFIAPDGVIGDVYHRIVQVNDFEGGHFAALENPGILAEDIFEAVEKMEVIHNSNSSTFVC